MAPVKKKKQSNLEAPNAGCKAPVVSQGLQLPLGEPLLDLLWLLGLNMMQAWGCAEALPPQLRRAAGSPCPAIPISGLYRGTRVDYASGVLGVLQGGAVEDSRCWTRQKWAANKKVYVPLKKYLSTGKCRHPSTVFFQHFVDKVRVWYGYGS